MTTLTLTAADRPRYHVTPGSPLHRALLMISLVGSVLFTLTYSIAGALRPGYSAVREPISALALGPDGWVQQANFIAFGLVAFVGAVAMHVALTPGRGSVWVPVLRVLSGLSMIVVGVFVTDLSTVTAPTLHGLVHTLASYVSLMSTVAYLIVLGARFVAEPRWRGWALWSWATAVIMMVSLAAFGAALATHGPAGVFERAASIIPSFLGIGLTIRLLAGTGQISTS